MDQHDRKHKNGRAAQISLTPAGKPRFPRVVADCATTGGRSCGLPKGAGTLRTRKDNRRRALECGHPALPYAFAYAPWQLLTTWAKKRRVAKSEMIGGSLFIGPTMSEEEKIFPEFDPARHVINPDAQIALHGDKMLSLRALLEELDRLRAENSRLSELLGADRAGCLDLLAWRSPADYGKLVAENAELRKENQDLGRGGTAWPLVAELNKEIDRLRQRLNDKEILFCGMAGGRTEQNRLLAQDRRDLARRAAEWAYSAHGERPEGFNAAFNQWWESQK